MNKRNEAKKKTPSAEAFLQLPLQNPSAQPKSGPRLPAFFTVVPPYASRPGGVPTSLRYVEKCPPPLHLGWRRPRLHASSQIRNTLCGLTLSLTFAVPN